MHFREYKVCVSVRTVSYVMFYYRDNHNNGATCDGRLALSIPHTSALLCRVLGCFLRQCALNLTCLMPSLLFLFRFFFLVLGKSLFPIRNFNVFQLGFFIWHALISLHLIVCRTNSAHTGVIIVSPDFSTPIRQILPRCTCQNSV